MSRLLPYSVALALVITATWMRGESASAESVSLDDFLNQVQTNHPLFKSQQLNQKISDEQQKRFLGREDWFIAANPSYRYVEPVRESVGDSSKVHNFHSDVSAERNFWATGGQLSLFFSHNYRDQDVDELIIPTDQGNVSIPLANTEFYKSGLGVSYRQPLLQNFGGVLDRLEYDLAGYDVDIADLRAKEAQEDFLLSLGLRYVDWALLSETVEIANRRLALAERQLSQTRRKHQVNLVEQADLLRAEDDVRIAKQRVVLLKSRRDALRAELAALSKNSSINSADPKLNLYQTDPLPSPDKAIEQVQKSSRLLSALSRRQEQLVKQRKGFLDSKRAKLDLTVSAGLYDGEDSFGSSLGMEQPDISVGIEYLYPLGTRTANADIAKTQLQLKQNREDLDDVRTSLEARLRNVLGQAHALTDILSLNRKQVQSSKKRTAEENRLYQQGKNDLNFVLASQDNEAVAEATYAENGASYQKFVLQYKALSDQLFAPVDM